ncbi:SLC13 family permease [Aliiroseovarius subalbicans]|uniref:SLC13 family permease n=1 Tax=Aliiroseovarius subalbicans TaxID=2925840 RepID=UPI001F5948B5|nr:SLC13 family permease [Aliiroseovarius subalbicans]MCI2400543.1 SLC13 family permease [Aliiroseovarius subalbicans]
MDPLILTQEMIAVLCVLGITMTLFVTEVVRVDLAAIMVMVLVGALSYLPGLENLADINQLFAGFSSNAVISIIAVMIIGAGLDKTGIMNKVAAVILKHGGTSEARLIPIISGTVGVISSFMQNVGAAALFLPVVSRISARTGLPLGRMLMPMGFCAILGGTMTLVGSSPMILLNDLIASANADLPQAAQMEPFDLFDPAPVGLALILSGIAYFVLFGRWVLPAASPRDDAAAGQSIAEYLKATYRLKADLVEVIVPEGNILVGQTLDDIMLAHHLYIIGTSYAGQKVIAPRVTTEILTPCRLAILGHRKVIEEICDIYGLTVLPGLEDFAEDFAATRAGVAEVVITPGSDVIGKTGRDLRFRQTHGMSLLAIHRGEETMSLVETDEHKAAMIGDIPFLAGDTLVVHTPWDMLSRLKQDRDFVVVTSDFPEEELRPKKVGWALLFFLLALGLILFSDVRLSLCLLIGAVGMIVTRVLSIDEAYESVGWSTVFLLASLIPLGMAVQNTGTAGWIAQQVLTLLDGWPIWALQAGVAVLATLFTLVMSNVGATVLLVPLAVSIAVAAGGDPAIFALTVAISTSNSFLIPTHQVNALIMGPAGYRVADFLRSGGIMTLLFLVVSQGVMALVY